MRSQIESLESALDADRNPIASHIRNEYKEAARREALLRQDCETQARIIGEQAERAIQYNILKREATRRGKFTMRCCNVSQQALPSLGPLLNAVLDSL